MNDSLTGVGAGTYPVSLLDTNGCIYSDSFTVTQPDSVRLVVQDTLLCSGDSITLAGNAIGGNGAPYTYQWQGLIGSGPHTFAPTQDTVIYLQAIDPLGCVSDTDSIRLTLREIVFLTAPPEQSLCSGREVTVSLQVTSAGDTSNLTVLWQDPALGTGAIKTFIPTQTEYPVSVVEGCDANALDTVRFRFEAAPQPGFTQSLEYNCEEVVLNLENTSQSADSIRWYLPDGTSVTGEDRVSVRLPYTTTNPIISLEAWNSFCTERDSIQVGWGSLVEEIQAAIPNVITPNGDGLNDFFRLGDSFKLTECFEVSVYNRWGHLAYEGPGPWDGRTFSGEQLPSGTYYYIARLADGSLEATGYIQILRD